MLTVFHINFLYSGTSVSVLCLGALTLRHNSSGPAYKLVQAKSVFSAATLKCCNTITLRCRNTKVSSQVLAIFSATVAVHSGVKFPAGSLEQPGSPSSPEGGGSHSRPHRSLSHLTGQSLLRSVPTEGLASSLVSNRPPQLPKSASFMQVRPATGYAPAQPPT